ncbi:glutaredoxin family protein [Porticoccus sp. W117]|uniref:glutaredoxin family protein n=1 Tax=Porticoccus sp. W117 TaxID=3054777 RepID=UPI0025924337|nr:glutaredoxin family protein [Porticoccus sp. W117]MDM3871097.1 glutaredoxin family protein [Porticoccus sp. W117]
MELVLYTGPQCTLCDKAKQVIWPVIAATGHKLVERDITSDIAWLRKYRTTIPVVALGDRELNWPFDQQQLYQWLNQ